MALGALAISSGMFPLSMGGDIGTKRDPIVITPGKAKLKTDKDDHNELVNIGRRLLESMTGQSQQGGDTPKPKSAKEKANLRDKDIEKSDTDKKSMVESLTQAFDKLNSNDVASKSLKLFLLASGLFILFKFTDKIARFLAPVLGFVKLKLIPFISDLFTAMKDNPLGIAPTAAAMSLGFSRISAYFKGVQASLAAAKGIGATGPILKVATTTRGAQAAGTVAKGANLLNISNFAKIKNAFTIFRGGLDKFFISLTSGFNSISKFMKESKTVKVIGKGISIIGKGFGLIGNLFKGLTNFFTLGAFSKIGSFIKLFAPAALAFSKTIPLLGQVVMVIQGVIGFFMGTIQGIIDFIKDPTFFNFIFIFTKGFAKAYDLVIGSFLNLLSDIVGAVLGFFGFDKAAEFFKNLDFSIAGIFGFINRLKNMIYNSDTGELFGFKIPEMPSISDVMDWVTEFGKKIYDSEKGTLFGFKIPSFKSMNIPNIGDMFMNFIGGMLPAPGSFIGKGLYALPGTEVLKAAATSFSAGGQVVDGQMVTPASSVSQGSTGGSNPNLRAGTSTQSMALKEVVAEEKSLGSKVGGFFSSVFSPTTNNNSSNTTQNMAGSLGIEHTDPVTAALNDGNRIG